MPVVCWNASCLLFSIVAYLACLLLVVVLIHLFVCLLLARGAFRRKGRGGWAATLPLGGVLTTIISVMPVITYHYCHYHFIIISLLILLLSLSVLLLSLLLSLSLSLLLVVVVVLIVIIVIIIIITIINIVNEASALHPASQESGCQIDSSRFLILRGGIHRPMGFSQEN